MSEQASKMWSGRFREPLDPLFEQWQRSLPFDWRLLPQEVAASKAHARTLAAASIFTAAEFETTVGGLDRVLTRIAGDATQLTSANPAIANSSAEDIHHFVELELTQEIGDLALKLHTGRSRNEQIATDLRLFVRDAIDNSIAQLVAWAAALLEHADEAESAAMPSYTHLQRAEPVLLAHWLLAYVEMILRDISRFEDCRARLNFCPLGSGAVAGATLALDRSIAAQELKFTAPTANSMDATSDRDFALEFAQAASTLGLHISRFAEEITLYSTAEFGFVELPEAFSTGSSAMPQKKNPDLTELLRGKSGRLLGAATTLATLIKGLPLAYNKDLQETQEPVFEIAETLRGLLALLPGFTAAVHFRHDRLLSAAQTGFLNAMAAATYLVHKGLPFRKAHEKVGNAVRYCLDKECELGDLTLYELRQFGEEFDEDFFDAITLQATLDCHDVIGGTARARVRAAVESTEARVRALAERYGVQFGAEEEAAHAGA
ncbi:MAG TPA: argininosuccinate lyase [Acidobacteriaceae bacterium]|nr:argininosuccinate lyase [Acidobacteriaceae bacterium]